MKKLIAVLLSICVVLSVVTVAVSGADEVAVNVTSFEEAAQELQKEDEVYPTVIIHGIGQSNVNLEDEDGNIVYDEDGDPITGWPIYFNTNNLIKKLAFPLVMTLLTQRDCGLTKAAYEAVYDELQDMGYNEDGTPKSNFVVDSFDNRSVAECTPEEKKYIYDRVALQDYTAEVGEENLYYFAYNSFGDTYSIVDDLEELIEKVKADTGKDKINLIPISLGGAISVAYINEHPDGEDINKIIFIVPALDGSEIVGKVMLNELDYSDEGLYRNMFSKLMEGDYTGWMVNVLIRILPKQIYKDFLAAVAGGLTDSLLTKVANMWALVPGSMYDELAAEHLTPGTEFTKKIERFHEAQQNLEQNLRNYADKGIQIYDINGYGLELYSLVNSDSSTDTIIHSSSTSIGATFGKVGEPLPDGYTQQKYPEYDFISPDGEVDVSTCEFPFTTWFFVDQSHDSIGNNDVVVRLASKILLYKNMNVFSDPNYPQFNGARDSKGLYERIAEVKSWDVSALTIEQLDVFNNALANAEAIFDTTIVVPGEMEAASAELEAALVTVGLAAASEPDATDQVLYVVFHVLSEALYKFFGPQGFADPALRFWDGVLGILK